jgi:hypothetical protein
MWQPFSRDHLGSAITFTRQCARIEETAAGLSEEEKSEPRKELRYFASAAFVTATAFLEAAVNETFAVAGETSAADMSVGKDLKPEDRTSLDRLRPFTNRMSLLEKYELALAALAKPPFDRGASPYQEASSLVKVRNALIHYVPEWATGGAEEDAKGIAALLKGRFVENPLTGAGNPFFPDKCLGSGGAAWATKSALSFADEFFSRLNVTPSHAHFRADVDSLKTAEI